MILPRTGTRDLMILTFTLKNMVTMDAPLVVVLPEATAAGVVDSTITRNALFPASLVRMSSFLVSILTLPRQMCVAFLCIVIYH